MGNFWLASDGYRRPPVPPRDPRLHDPGRLPAGRHGTGGPGYTFEDEFQAQGGSWGTRDGERRPRYERVAVLHRHVESCPWLDGKHTVFGRVTSGQDVVDRISLADRDPRDRPQTPITIERVELAA